MKFASSLPWFMYDIYNKQLITSATIPEGEIKDTKSIILTETPIPGRNFQPISPGGNGNRTVSFSLPICRRDAVDGNIMLVKKFEILRNQAQGILGLAARRGQFASNPKVLYSWGVGMIPLVWYVSKCDIRNTANMVNAVGAPQHSVIDIELKLDETNVLYAAEEQFRNAAAILGSVESLFAMAQSRSKGNPF